MTHVGEVGLVCTDSFSHLNSFVQIEMGDMFFPLQRVQYQNLGAPEPFEGFVGDKIRIGDVTEVLNSESKDGHAKMCNHQWHAIDTHDLKRPSGDFKKLKLWDARIFGRFKGIMKFIAQLFQYTLMAIDRHVLGLKKIIGTHIVQSSGMVFVTVREKNGIQLSYVLAQHLLAKVRTGVDHKTLVIKLEVYRGA